MSFKYVWSLIVLSLLLTSCSSHTDKIKQQLGSDFNEQIYLSEGGEVASQKRVQVWCKAFKQNKVNKVQLQLAMMKEFTGDQLKLANAEVVIADKECKHDN